MRMATTLLTIGLAFLPAVAWAQATSCGATGTLSAVSNGPGDAVDPHVSGDLVSYTDINAGIGAIRYHDLVSGTDSQITSNEPSSDVLSDVDNTTIVYLHRTRTNETVSSFDTATNGPPTQLAAPAGVAGPHPSIGGPTVAWAVINGGFTSSQLVNSQVFAYDRPSGSTIQLTNDAFFNTQPGVSPTGNVVVYSQCSPTFPPTSCNIYADILSNGAVLTSRQLTTADINQQPDTNGLLVAYQTGAGASQIHWQAVTGGPEYTLPVPGNSRNPHLAGSFMSFEHLDAGIVPTWHVYVYDIATNALFQITNTPQHDFLSDISQDASDNLQVVFNRRESSAKVYDFSFNPVACTGRDSVTGAGVHGNQTQFAILASSDSSGGNVQGWFSFTEPNQPTNFGTISCLFVEANNDGSKGGIATGRLVYPPAVAGQVVVIDARALHQNGGTDLLRFSFNNGYITPDPRGAGCYLPILGPVPVTQGHIFVNDPD